VATATRVLISTAHNLALVLRTRVEATRDGDTEDFVKESLEIPDGIIGAITNGQAAERRGYELLAIWLHRHHPAKISELGLEPYLPKKLR
jgi:hypothetical protein